MDVRVRNNVNIVGIDDAPTVMLAHGFGCDQAMWHRVTAALSGRFRIVLFDHVGSGNADPAAWDPIRYATLDSYASDILDIVDGLELRDTVFVGHSVAAMMGVLAAAARPSAFAKLVLVTPSPCYIDDGDYRGGFSRADIDDLLDSLESNYLGWSRAIASTIAGNPERPELSEELAETFCRTDPACAKVFARTTFLSDNRGDLAKVSLPTLILECAEDVIAPTGVGAYVASQISGSKLVTLDTTGHCPQLSAPESTAAEIASFVDGPT
ncbi:alpha/beta fold hydrolase [Mycobacterium asiaticum]|uniref:Sigma factor sigB regulation protein rsbQ n=1 Tax=Mycobacterium asiaticum TaxID=1790 RepID=A0A1A3MTY2_MYCAS|nr:alpha/beta hydrolase [Mycobacterium asiaticum]OBK12259.1 sigma factor sigB regulation protein rsbQ [Mycobacterium asiaticum]